MEKREKVSKKAPPGIISEGQMTEKKPYRTPKLTEWGLIRDLTQGVKSGTQDYPAAGGTEPI